MMPTPKERLVKFYKKHNPEKIDEVDRLLTKYAGSYEKMVKVLESKYEDYGFFIGWEQDSDWRVLMQKEMKKTLAKAKKLWRRHAPWGLQRTVYNIWSNVEFVINKVRALVVPPPERPKKRSSSRKR